MVHRNAAGSTPTNNYLINSRYAVTHGMLPAQVIML